MSAALETVAQAILALRRPRPVRAVIDGRSAAGKTTLSHALAERLAPAGACGAREAAHAVIDNEGPANPGLVRCAALP